MKSRQSIYKFKDHIYQAEIWLFHQGTSAEMEAYLQKKLDPDIKMINTLGLGGCVDTIQNDRTGRIIYTVWIRNKCDFSTLCHEAFHLTCRIFRDRGVLLDFSVTGREEHFAYYQDSLITGLGRLMKGKK